jgi:hypothetical protein
MSTVTKNPGVDRALNLVTSRAALLGLAVLTAHTAVLLAYLHATETIIAPRRAMVPIVWITFAVWLVAHLKERGLPTESGLFAPAVGAGYFLVLASLGGILGLGAESISLAVQPATPGWGPVVLGSAAPVQVVLVPFKVAGYLALSYGVYRAVAAASRGAVAGVLGLFACISCTLPVIAAVGSVLTGATLAFQPGSLTYDLATGVFVLTVVLLAVAVPTER